MPDGDDMRSVIESAIEEVSEDEGGEESVSESVKTSTSDSQTEDDAGSEATDTEGEAASTEEVEQGASETSATGEGEAEADPDPLDAPTHWSAEHQEMFRELKADAQSFLLDRSRDMEAAHTRRSQEIAPLRNAVSTWEPYLRQQGHDPAQAFNALMQTEYTLRSGTNEQKLAMLEKLAIDYNVHLGAEATSDQWTDENDPFGSNRAAAQAVQPVLQQMQQMQAGIQQQAHAGQSQQVQTVERQIEVFRTEKGADGKAAHPYFEEVMADMQVMAQANHLNGQPSDLAELYEKACWADASVRAKVQAAEKHKASLDQRKTEQRRAKKARGATGGLSGGGGKSKEQPRSLRETIEGAMDEHAS